VNTLKLSNERGHTECFAEPASI